MSQSFGNPGRKPSNRRPSTQNQPGRNFAGNNSYDTPLPDTLNEAPAPDRQSREESQLTQASDSNLEKIDPTRRLIAFIIDSLAYYVIAMLLCIVPGLNHFLTITATSALLLLVKDFPFGGRGIGKNLMGLQVVDVKTFTPCGLKQSVLRNIIILGPYAALQVISVILAFIPNSMVIDTVMKLFNVVSTIYLGFVLPVECYRAYSREDSRRLGDQWAGTAIIESHMDFSRPFSE